MSGRWIVAVTLLASASHLNLGNAILRFVPVSDRRRALGRERDPACAPRQWYRPKQHTRDIAAFDDALQPLRRFHLIAGDGERWRMHRLVCGWTRRVASTEALGQANRKIVEGCVAYSQRITLEEGFRVYQADGKHLEQATEEAVIVLGADDPRVSELQDRLGAALQSMGDLPRAKALRELALASDLKNLGEDHPWVAIRRSNLAAVLRDLGELPRAKMLLELALASDLKNLGEDHSEVAIRRSNLAVILKDLGELPRAKELLEFFRRHVARSAASAAIASAATHVRPTTPIEVLGIAAAALTPSSDSSALTSCESSMTLMPLM